METREDDKVVWERAQNLHAQYWTAADGNPENYDILTGEFVRGLLSETRLVYLQAVPDQFEIRMTGGQA